ncbi:hypothetical protein J2755_001895 [Methanohalophilus levihalophilus]|uniref:hypothetical protein n=1 Tax=Methanohalophilus levihalophilus TaxID=1431282 RepID=UPI001AE55683|nr:hypothetical protein [Methanohalophilus levihalophilus]MBP2030947.1 hypothetical protein [Methanohalophilus levihalophilus]
MEYEIEGGVEESVKEGIIIGNSHVCVDCLEELRDALKITKLEHSISDVEYEIYEETMSQ